MVFRLPFFGAPKDEPTPVMPTRAEPAVGEFVTQALRAYIATLRVRIEMRAASHRLAASGEDSKLNAHVYEALAKEDEAVIGLLEE